MEILNIYGSNKIQQRSQLWLDLENKTQDMSKLWLDITKILPLKISFI